MSKSTQINWAFPYFQISGENDAYAGIRGGADSAFFFIFLFLSSTSSGFSPQEIS